MDKVIVKDDTFRTNAVEVVMGKMLLSKDSQGRQLQHKVTIDVVFEGPALTHAVKRALRWMRSKKFHTQRPPRHIDLMLVAFHHHDKGAFEAALKEA